MKMPKFKATKWKLDYCLECKKVIGRYQYVCKRDHNVIQRDNVPFFVKEMKIFRFGKWSALEATNYNQDFPISRSNLSPIILECGVEPGGYIKDQWWMWSKIGILFSIKWLPPDEDGG